MFSNPNADVVHVDPSSARPSLQEPFRKLVAESSRELTKREWDVVEKANRFSMRCIHGFHQLVAAGLLFTDCIWDAFQDDVKIGNSSRCAEAHLMHDLDSAGQTLASLIIVHGPVTDRPDPWSVLPCAACRDMLVRVAPNAWLLHNLLGEMAATPMFVFAPMNTATWGIATLKGNSVLETTRNFVLETSQAMTGAELQLVSAIVPQREQYVAGAVDTSGVQVIRTAYNRQLWSMPICPERRVVSEVEHNGRRLLSLAVMRRDWRGATHCELPCPNCVEALSQFSPKLTVINDFAKYGRIVTPISTIYPSPYASRKR